MQENQVQMEKSNILMTEVLEREDKEDETDKSLLSK